VMARVETGTRAPADLLGGPVEWRAQRDSSPRLSTAVIIPAYNAETVLGETLDSVAAQTLRPDEVIVVDDGSRDRTAAIAEAHPAVTRVIRKANGGICAARNDAIESGSSDLVMPLDADDLWHPLYVERMVAMMSAHPEALSGFARWRGWLHPAESPVPFEATVGDDIVMHDFASYDRAMLGGLPVLPSFHVARRSALRKIGLRPYPEHQNMGEAAYMCGLLAAMGPVAEHVAPLGRYRLHANALTGDEIDAARRVPPCLEDLRRTIANRADLGIDASVRRRVDLHAAGWHRRCGRRLGGGGHVAEARRLLIQAAMLGDRRAMAMLAASLLPGVRRRVWVEAWRPDVVRREAGTEAWSLDRAG
jgi:glycosyltransferase involved in cell wall biosynthesis